MWNEPAIFNVSIQANFRLNDAYELQAHKLSANDAGAAQGPPIERACVSIEERRCNLQAIASGGHWQPRKEAAANATVRESNRELAALCNTCGRSEARTFPKRLFKLKLKQQSHCLLIATSMAIPSRQTHSILAALDMKRPQLCDPERRGVLASLQLDGGQILDPSGRFCSLKELERGSSRLAALWRSLLWQVRRNRERASSYLFGGSTTQASNKGILFGSVRHLGE